MTGEYIFTMQGMTKNYERKTVLENINLCFYHGAKIGFVGQNGAGKSTLLRIMAQEDKEFSGIAQPLKGTKIRFLPQEPKLGSHLTVREAVENAFQETKTLIEEFSTLQIYGLRGIGVSIPLILPFSSKSNLKKFYVFLKDWRSSRFMFLAETVGACIGLILIILALDSGSVYLVAAISSGTRPIFVVIIGLFLSLIGKKIKEEFDIYNGLIKISSAVFVGIGILLVSINI